MVDGTEEHWKVAAVADAGLRLLSTPEARHLTRTGQPSGWYRPFDRCNSTGLGRERKGAQMYDRSTTASCSCGWSVTSPSQLALARSPNSTAAKPPPANPHHRQLPAYAAEIQRAEGVRFTEDEISFVAMHIDAHLEVQAARAVRLRTVVVCPAHHEMATRLRERLEREFDRHLDITGPVPRLDGVDYIDADLVISTVPLSGQDAPVVVVNVFPTWKDIESVRAAITRATRNRDRASAPHRLSVAGSGAGSDVANRLIRPSGPSRRSLPLARSSGMPSSSSAGRGAVPFTMLVDVGAVPAGELACRFDALLAAGGTASVRDQCGRELDHMRSGSPSVRCGRLYI
ncbi:hypothetical protein [Streptomyces sp. NPDC087437]|uniref:hypothetical protein n=1 Tax=Streptomyces sp. NPDC087437 TaxID=3365789 RepID=UPI003822CA17